MIDLAIGPATQVTMHFALKLEDGSVVDSNFDGSPVTFAVGDGNVLPGFEQALFGLRTGARQTLLVTTEHAFGQRNPSNIQKIAREEFPADVELSVGLMISFADAQNSELPGVVSEFDDQTVTVDFNHPLAGRDIYFDVQILDVEPAVTH